MKTLLSLSALTLLVLAGAGCKNPVDAARERATQKVNEYVTEKAMEKVMGGDAKVDINGNKDITVTNKDGGQISIGASAKLPTNLSADIVVYPGAKTSSATFDGSGKNGGFTQTTPDSPDKVYDYLSGKFLAQGFKRTIESRAEGVIISGFEKGNVKFMLTLSKGESDAETALTFSRSEGAE